MLVYKTQRIVKIPSRCLAITYYFIVFAVIVYIGGYALGFSKAYQTRCPPESVVVTKVKGVIRTTFTDKELAIPNPQFYRRVWDASDIVVPALGGEFGGFFILTNVIITPNQTRGICAEDQNVTRALCAADKDCPAGRSLQLGNGVMTGKCVTSDKNVHIKTCEIEAWCPIQQRRLPLESSNTPLLLGTQDFTVLIKNSIEFPEFGPSYKRRNILDSATNEYLQQCLYNEKTDPYCPTFRIGDIVKAAKEDYKTVGRTGAVFGIQIKWDCSFDWGKTIKNCLPKYSFSRLDNPHAQISPGFNFRSAVYHEENRRTLTQNFGLKFLLEVEGEGRRFDSFKFVLAIGASMGLFAIASSVCDKLMRLMSMLKKRYDPKWLRDFSEEMKYDLSHVQCAKNKKIAKGATNLGEEVQTMQV